MLDPRLVGGKTLKREKERPGIAEENVFWVVFEFDAMHIMTRILLWLVFAFVI